MPTGADIIHHAQSALTNLQQAKMWAVQAVVDEAA